MGFLSDKPYTAITAHIERYTSDDYDEDDVAEVVDLVEIIRIRGSVGATEAARAIRKRLKYGSVHNQLRALTILDALVENGGPEMRPLYRDEFLLERLRLMLTEPGVNKSVKRKLENYIIGWSNSLRDEKGYEALVRMSHYVSHRRLTKPRESTAHHGDEDSHDDDDDTRQHERRDTGRSSWRYSNPDDGEIISSRRVRGDLNNRDRSGSREASPGVSQSSHKKSGSKSNSRSFFSSLGSSGSRGSGGAASSSNIDPKSITEAIALASSTATNLTNALALVNTNTQLPSENTEATKYFNECRHLRRRILRYIHSTTSEKHMGPLIHANEELVAALQKYDAMCHQGESDLDDWKVERSMNQLRMSDEDSDSEPYSAPRSPRHAKRTPPPISPKPPHIYSKPRARDNEDPFADVHAED